MKKLLEKIRNWIHKKFNKEESLPKVSLEELSKPIVDGDYLATKHLINADDSIAIKVLDSPQDLIYYDQMASHIENEYWQAQIDRYLSGTVNWADKIESVQIAATKLFEQFESDGTRYGWLEPALS